MKCDKFPLPARFHVPPKYESITNLTPEFMWKCNQQPISILHYSISRPNQYIFTWKLNTEKKKLDLFIWVSGQRDRGKLPLPWPSNTGLQMSFMSWDFFLGMDITENLWSFVLSSGVGIWPGRRVCSVAWVGLWGKFQCLIESQTEHEQVRYARKKPHLLATLQVFLQCSASSSHPIYCHSTLPSIRAGLAFFWSLSPEAESCTVYVSRNDLAIVEIKIFL